MIRLLTLLVLLVPCATGCQEKESLLEYAMELPGGKDARTPALFMLHGYGSNERDLKSLAKTIAPDFAVFSLRAPLSTSQVHGGFCWFQLEFLPEKKFRYDYSEVVRSRKLVLEFIRQTCKTHRLDTSDIYLLGFSQGAMMCYDIALSEPGLIRGVLALSGGIMEETQKIKLLPAVKSQKFFIAHGRNDDIVSFAESARAALFLKEAGVRHIEVRAYDAPHTITQQEIAHIGAWLAAVKNQTGSGQ
jgi:phospholipase/carboxylesterase